jgi:hypothetical protein
LKKKLKSEWTAEMARESILRNKSSRWVSTFPEPPLEVGELVMWEVQVPGKRTVEERVGVVTETFPPEIGLIRVQFESEEVVLYSSNSTIHSWISRV